MKYQNVTFSLLLFRLSELQLTNTDKCRNGGMMSMEEFMSNKTWNPSVSDDGRLLQMRLEFNSQPAIVKGDQLKLTLNGSDFRVETTDQQGCSAYRQVTLFKSAQLAQLKCQFDEERRCLNISVPLHWTTISDMCLDPCPCTLFFINQRLGLRLLLSRLAMRILLLESPLFQYEHPA